MIEIVSSDWSPIGLMGEDREQFSPQDRSFPRETNATTLLYLFLARLTWLVHLHPADIQ